MTTREVADYLRLKERKIYELVHRRAIPCSRVTGKLLFPKQLVDLWITRHVDFAGPALAAPPPVAAGSHDPLLDWALRQSRSGLAILAGGSEDGLHRLARGEALIAALHIIDPESGDYNVAAVSRLAPLADLVLIEWAKREQGLVTAAGNPKRIRGMRDLRRRGVRLAQRQEGAGAQILLRHLLAREGLAPEALAPVTPPALTETDIATAILDGTADCGLAIRAVAQRFGLGFIPLHQERFDLAMRRRDYFAPAVQKLLRFARSTALAERARTYGGYDLAELGRVVHNA